MDFDYWKVTTFVFAAIAAYVAYQQFRLSREKFKLDLFEKRFKIFSGAGLFITHIFPDGDLKTLDHAWEYRAAIGEASFLFGNEITDYLEEIIAVPSSCTRIVKRSSLCRSVKNGPNLLSKFKNLGWLTDQLPELKEQFASYMKFETWK